MGILNTNLETAGFEQVQLYFILEKHFNAVMDKGSQITFTNLAIGIGATSSFMYPYQYCLGIANGKVTLFTTILSTITIYQHFFTFQTLTEV